MALPFAMSATTSLLLACTILAGTSVATAGQILANDIVSVGCYAPTDAACTGKEGMRMEFDLCCSCFRWSYEGDVSSTKKGEHTLGDDKFDWVSHITDETCSGGTKGTANKHAGTVGNVASGGCIQQTEGKTYMCKIQKIVHRAEACDKITPVCEQGPFAGDKYVPLSGSSDMSGGRPGGGGMSSGGGGPPGASHKLTIDWMKPFSDPSARTQTAPHSAQLEFAWDSKHNVYKMANRAAWENCDFLQV